MRHSTFIRNGPFDAEVLHEDKLPLNVKYIEEQYKAKYIGEFTLKAKGGGWANKPVAIFWQAEAHPRGSNWFGLYRHEDGRWMITDAQAIVGVPINGLMNEKHEVIYSAYRHDCQSLNDMMIDGGRDYVRSSIGFTPVQFKIEEDGLVWVTQ